METQYQVNMVRAMQALKKCTSNSRIKQRLLKEFMQNYFRTMENKKVISGTEVLANGFDREALLDKYRAEIIYEFADALSQFVCFEYFEDTKTREMIVLGQITIMDLSKGIPNHFLDEADDEPATEPEAT